MNRPNPEIRPGATYADILAAPPNKVAELVAGRLHLQPRPAPRHARASSALGSKIGGPFDYDDARPGGWWILDEPELHLGRDVLVPDLAGWRRDRMARLPEAAAFDLAPDWVCEVLSPTTRRFDLTEKRALYGRAGVGHLWLIDPEARTLEAFENADGTWVLRAALSEDDAVQVAPFEAVSFALSALWAG
ncbi:MAG: Uma2 family endonuclease [Pseudomonadota bacterium]